MGRLCLGQPPGPGCGVVAPELYALLCPSGVGPMRPALLVSLLVLSGACTIRVIQPAPAAVSGGGPKPDSAKKDLPWKPFAEVTKDARVQTGLFTVYLKRESAYLALKPEQLDRDYLMVTRSEERRVGKECRSRWSPY